uniref:Uncharacterized protein n=1 Tax=Gopherus agassizii TaxID=38772 RepID=A0A452GZJ9_9SAUR
DSFVNKLQQFAMESMPWCRQDVSANPRAHVGRAGRTKLCCWRASQPGRRCQLCLLSLFFPARSVCSCFLCRLQAFEISDFRTKSCLNSIEPPK